MAVSCMIIIVDCDIKHFFGE